LSIDLSAVTQHDFVFTGSVCVWTLQKDGSTAKTVYGKYSYVTVPPYTPHVFEFLEDSVVAEWWDGPFGAWFYEPYRSSVQQSFTAPTTNSSSSCTSDLALVEIGKPKNTLCSMFAAESNAILTAAWQAVKEERMLLSGIALGLAVGYMMGHRRRRW
jgi:hypothetical protein